MKDTVKGGRRIIWPHVLTVISAAILISAEVFGAAFAAGWAVANLAGLAQYWVHILQALFFAAGVAIMVQFLIAAHRVEPFTTRD
jgi:hypothetical protein